MPIVRKEIMVVNAFCGGKSLFIGWNFRLHLLNLVLILA